MDKKFVFLILHYLSIKDTKRCVESIQTMCVDYNYNIVIVDNGSNNDTGYVLEKLYKSDNKIKVIISDKNLGFACGNNLGFKYIKNHLSPDFIIMINNDTYLIQEDFCKLISKEYEKSNFAVLGPRIIMNDNKISDYPFEPETLKYVKKKIRSLKIRKKLNYIHLLWVYEIFRQLKRFLLPPQCMVTSERLENVVLQGAALIFSIQYINMFDGIDDRTFLYNEEQLLYWRIKNNNLLSVYNPFLLIYHNENSSTNILLTRRRQKNMFIINNELKSTKILLDDLKNQEKNV